MIKLIKSSILFVLYLTLTIGIAFIFFMMGIRMVVEHPRAGLNSITMWQIAQNWRQTQSLQPYNRNELICEFAAIRAYEIQSNFSHDLFLEPSTFKTKIWDSGFTTLDENIVRADVKGEEYAFELLHF